MTDTTLIVPAGSSDSSNRSGVSWGAIIAGALAACVTSLLLGVLGAGLGLSSISPWSDLSASATALGVGAAIWLIVMQWVASGVGGYLAGRLRTKWLHVHTHEVFFKDTAHGFLAWALATLVSVVLLGSAATSVLTGTASTATSVVSGAAQGAMAGATANADAISGYFVDMLYRRDAAAAPQAATDTRAEAGRILLSAVTAGEITPADKTYLASLISASAGIPTPDAEKRIDDALAQAKATAEKVKQAAEEARKASAKLAFFLFFSLLVGAFIASVAAAYGGSERDDIENRLKA
jgi:hypothetical protein